MQPKLLDCHVDLCAGEMDRRLTPIDLHKKPLYPVPGIDKSRDLFQMHGTISDTHSHKCICEYRGVVLRTFMETYSNCTHIQLVIMLLFST